MQSILQEICYKHGMEFLRNKQDSAILQRISTNEGMLTKNFNKWQKKMYLRIIDDKDELADNQANEHFMFGIRYGVMFMMEVFRDQIEFDC